MSDPCFPQTSHSPFNYAFPPTAGCSAPSLPPIVLCLLLSCSRWFQPPLLCRLAIFCLGVPVITSLSLVTNVQHLVHLFFFILAICPAHLHFYLSAYSIMFIIIVLFFICEHGILSSSFRFNIFHCSLSDSQFVCQLFIERLCLAAMGHCWQYTLAYFLLLLLLFCFWGFFWGGGGGG